MASIGTDPNGHRRILFVARDGKRKTVRLGKCSERDAAGIQRHMEALLAASINGQAISRETAVWLAEIADVLHDRLTRVGLIEPRPARDAAKLGTFIDGYMAQRVDLKSTTVTVLRQAKRSLVQFTGEAKALSAITPGDADAYRAALLGRNLARATVNKLCRYARHFFEVAKRRRLIDENPFAHITGAVKGDPTRRAFIQASDVLKVIDAAPDPQWKLLIAMARFGGLRVPSEALALTWRDVDFEHNRFTVRSSKTEHHDGGGVRIVPMFPELAKHFQAVFADAPEGSDFVITRYRDPAANLRTQLVRYITAAGLTAWGKPWQNLRASCATELADTFPSHVCAAWLGHSEAVADAFYRQVTDEHFARAAIGPAQNPAQQPHETVCKGSHAKLVNVQNQQENPPNANDCEVVRSEEMGHRGLEPLTSSMSTRRASQLRQWPAKHFLTGAYGLDAFVGRSFAQVDARRGIIQISHRAANFPGGREVMTGPSQDGVCPGQCWWCCR